jgi:O-succinylbenzoate synthase
MKNTQMSLKDHNDIIQAIEHFNISIEQACNSTSNIKEHHISTSITIREKLKKKHNVRKQWQHYRSPIIKTKLNKAIKDLKKLLSEKKNSGISIQIYLRNISSVPLKHLITLYGRLLKKLEEPQ